MNIPKINSRQAIIIHAFAAAVFTIVCDEERIFNGGVVAILIALSAITHYLLFMEGGKKEEPKQQEPKPSVEQDFKEYREQYSNSIVARNKMPDCD